MSSLRTFTWYIQGFIQKYAILLLISTVGGIVFFLVLPRFLSNVSFWKKTTYIGRVGSFPLARLPRDIQEKVSYGLVQIAEDGQVVPALASSYQLEENGKAYRFALKPNMTWQDGKVVVPQDVTYVFSDIEIARSQNDIMYRISTQKNDDAQPEPFLPSSFPSLVSQPLFRQEKSKNIFFQEKNTIIGLGEYRIHRLLYRGPAIRELVLESARERLIYRFYQTEHDAIVGFKHGDVDKLDLIQNIEDLADWQTVTKVQQLHNDQYIGIFFNLGYTDGTDQKYNNKLLRQALNYALQKPQGDERIASPIHKESWAYLSSEEDFDRFEQDMNLAVDTLLKAQLQTPLTIELKTIPSYTAKAETVKKSWEELGTMAVAACQKAGTGSCENNKIQVDISISNVPDLSNFQVLLVGQQIPTDPDQYVLWHSTQSTNFTRYKNARVDKLLEDARKSTNREERRLYYQEFQRTVVKDSPVIFLEPIRTYSIEKKMNIL